MSIYMTVFKCICMHEYMYVRRHVCIVCVYTCVHASMCICMYVYMYACVHTCRYVIFKLGFERYGGIVLVGGGNCEGELSGGGNVRFPAEIQDNYVVTNDVKLQSLSGIGQVFRNGP